MNHLDNFDETIVTLEAELEQIQASPLLGVTFLAGRQQRTIFEEDPALREVIEEYYRTRIEQMRRWENQVTGIIPGLS